MRSALVIFMGLHGIVHLFGFLKAFGLSEFNAIVQPNSKYFGSLWLLAFILFSATLVLMLLNNRFWWLSGLLAVLLSQSLIINHWTDAKFGTLANIIILLAVLIGYSGYRFTNKIQEERTVILQNSQSVEEQILTQKGIADLPPIIQKWLTSSGIIGKRPISNIYLTQELQLKMKPGQEDWYKGTAEQYFTVDPPAFHWDINTKMNPFLSVVGRDKFENGKGEMMIKLLSFLPVANAANDPKVNQATLQRFLAEIIWFPSAAMSPYIQWETLSEVSAKATMDYKGTIGSGEFHFDTNGNFKKFVAMRYQDAKASEPTEWTVIATKIEKRNGVDIPVECEAAWTLDSCKWTWLKVKIKDITYNLEKIPSSGSDHYK